MEQWMEVLICAVVLTGIAAAGIWICMRHRYIAFTEYVCDSIDRILNGKEMEETEEDTLTGKMQMRLERLQEITAAVAKRSEQQKLEVQGAISDISHQLKNPVANVVMYCDTAMNPALSAEDRARCMEILKTQVDKVDFLVQSMIRMSRLEQNIIHLNPEKTELEPLMEKACAGIAASAQKRKICVQMRCEKEIQVFCDEKWTLEAVGNVLDNAVKYSPEGGRVTVEAETFEIYARISITDEGIGILPEHITDVCRRFYREDRAAKAEGLGIGLYLTREILKKQNGYLKIRSKENVGTCVMIYLLRHAAPEF